MESFTHSAPPKMSDSVICPIHWSNPPDVLLLPAQPTVSLLLRVTAQPTPLQISGTVMIFFILICSLYDSRVTIPK